MTKEQKLLDIIVDAQRRTINLEEASKRILLLFNVSGNEANQPADKRDGEVAVGGNCEHNFQIMGKGYMCKKCGKLLY